MGVHACWQTDRQADLYLDALAVTVDGADFDATDAILGDPQLHDAVDLHVLQTPVPPGCQHQFLLYQQVHAANPTGAITLSERMTCSQYGPSSLA